MALTVVLFSSSPALAQDAPSHGWLDVKFISMRSTQDQQTHTLAVPLFREIASAAAAYPALPSVMGAGLEGGVQFHPRFGVGVHFDFVNYESTVGLAVRIPHPTLFNRFGTDADVTTTALNRRDRGFDVFATYIAPTPDQWRVRFFGGPTYFTVSQEMVDLIRYEQVFNVFTGANLVDITTFDQREVSGSTWGFNAGADVAYFFSRHVGVGGVIRVNRGTVTIDEEPLSVDTAELSAGHITFGGGLRLRF
jgi:hypothetical protein